MGIRDIASAAIEAEDAESAAQKKINWREHAKAGEQIVYDLLGVTGKAVRARQDAPSIDGTAPLGQKWGHDATVELEEGVFVKVTNTRHYREDPWGAYSNTEEVRHLMIVTEGGGIAKCSDGSYFNSPKIRSLADLGRALADYDKQPEIRRAERERRNAVRLTA